MSVCVLAYLRNYVPKLHDMSRISLTHGRARLSSDDSALIYALPVLWMTACCTYCSLLTARHAKKSKGSPYSIAERWVPELILVLGSQPAGDVSHIPAGRLPLLSTRPAVILATLKRAATSFDAW